ncbi:hypothetical protein ElyMa_003982700 [Elysia marginata]|uniref:Uncharacterized protein n=1 Tax=Elysia marginata TaxID=1093978 RepID=A0AAV4FZZ7_9GAST|nr:hypothetical protein ElyMa_003982700 [Elysia marginata]
MAERTELDLDLNLKVLDLNSNISLEHDDLKEKAGDRFTGGELDLDLIRDSKAADCANPKGNHRNRTDTPVVDCGYRNCNTAGLSFSSERSDISELKDCDTVCSLCVTPRPTCSDTKTTASSRSTPDRFELDLDLEGISDNQKGALGLGENQKDFADVDTQEIFQSISSNNLHPLISSVSSDSKPCSRNPQNSFNDSMKVTVAFEIDFNANSKTNEAEMPKKVKNSLQEAFLHFRKKRQGKTGHPESKVRGKLIILNPILGENRSSWFQSYGKTDHPESDVKGKLTIVNPMLRIKLTIANPVLMED